MLKGATYAAEGIADVLLTVLGVAIDCSDQFQTFTPGTLLTFYHRHKAELEPIILNAMKTRMYDKLLSIRKYPLPYSSEVILSHPPQRNYGKKCQN